MISSGLVCILTLSLLLLMWAAEAFNPSIHCLRPPRILGSSSRLDAAKMVSFHEESRSKLVQGINIVANAVKITLGPKGRNVVLGKSYGPPEIVNDGVTIAKDIVLEDPEMNAGARLVQEVASKSDNKAGDGTTTSTVMTQEIINQGLRVVAAGANPVSLRTGISIAARMLSEKVRSLAIPVKSNADLVSIATIAANNAEMGRIIAQTCEKVGSTGSTIVEESQTLNDEIEYTEGLSIDRGFLSPYFVKDAERQVCEMQNCRVLVTDKRISSVQELLPVLEQVVKTKEALFIIAEDITGEALSTLVVNKLRGVIDVVAIKAPSFGDRRKAYLQDIAIATGATYVSDEVGSSLDAVSINDLGVADRIVVRKASTTLVASPRFKEAIGTRIAQIRAEAQDTDSKFDKEKLEERASALGGGIVRLKVGAATETELRDKKLRYEDALNSVRSALEMGVVPGGGATMLFMSCDAELRKKVMDACADDDERLGAEILFRSLPAPMRQIALNAGRPGEVVVDKCKNQAFGFGYNAATDKYEDLRASGVLDPAKVTVNAIENAASISGLVLTTEALVTDLPERKPRASSRGGGAGFGSGGMDEDDGDFM